MEGQENQEQMMQLQILGQEAQELEKQLQLIDQHISDLTKLNEGLDDDDEFSVDNIEDRIDFLEKLYDSLKNMQTDYYKKILGM